MDVTAQLLGSAQDDFRFLIARVLEQKKFEAAVTAQALDGNGVGGGRAAATDPFALLDLARDGSPNPLMRIELLILSPTIVILHAAYSQRGCSREKRCLGGPRRRVCL